MQAHRRALVVGERSYGKGSIQTVFPLMWDNGGIKMTIGHYTDPLGRRIEGVGVQPDIEAPVVGDAPRPAYGLPDPGFGAAASWVRSQADVPETAPVRPMLRAEP